jgi:hypothetical protein
MAKAHCPQPTAITTANPSKNKIAAILSSLRCSKQHYHTIAMRIEITARRCHTGIGYVEKQISVSGLGGSTDDTAPVLL